MKREKEPRFLQDTVIPETKELPSNEFWKREFGDEFARRFENEKGGWRLRIEDYTNTAKILQSSSPASIELAARNAWSYRVVFGENPLDSESLEALSSKQHSLGEMSKGKKPTMVRELFEHRILLGKEQITPDFSKKQLAECRRYLRRGHEHELEQKNFVGAAKMNVLHRILFGTELSTSAQKVEATHAFQKLLRRRLENARLRGEDFIELIGQNLAFYRLLLARNIDVNDGKLRIQDPDTKEFRRDITPPPEQRKF